MSVTTKARPTKQELHRLTPPLRLSVDEATRFIYGMRQLELVKGILFAEDRSRMTGNPSPLDSDDMVIAALHVMREGLDALSGLKIHELALDLFYDHGKTEHAGIIEA